MFLQLSRPESTDSTNEIEIGRAQSLLAAQPATIDWILERIWYLRFNRRSVDIPFHSHPLFGDRLAEGGSLSFIRSALQYEKSADTFDFPIPHLIYAYMIENTRAYEIMGKLLTELLHDEKIGIATQNAQLWMRSTEELFFSDSPHGFITRVTSALRSDIRAIRRNAYFRMFGLDLNHGGGSDSKYPYASSRQYNANFVSTFEELLREVWRAISFVRSFAGINETDDAKIKELVRQLKEMLTGRRLNGNLSREEFVAVASMSWMHLTCLAPGAIFESLGIQAVTPQERLSILGEKVGYRAHPKADSFFQMAEPISSILIGIESGLFDNDAAPNLYLSDSARGNMETILTHWSIATGRNLKARDVNQMPASAMVR